MDEEVELRFYEQHANRYFAPTEGVRLSEWIRKVVLPTSDPRLRAILLEESNRAAAGAEPLFAGSVIQRRYSEAELQSAAQFSVTVKGFSEQAGEEHGTGYSGAGACPVCHAGERQTTRLYLRTRGLPARTSMSRTLANEVVVPEAVARSMLKAALGGFSLSLVLNKPAQEPALGSILDEAWARLSAADRARHVAPGSSGFILDLLETPGEQTEALRALVRGRVLFQLDVSGPTVELARATVTGDDLTGLITAQSRYRCPMGDTWALNLLSEVVLAGPLAPGQDIARTTQYVGVHRGLLRPRQLLIVSPRFRRWFLEAGWRGADFEVAHLADAA